MAELSSVIGKPVLSLSTSCISGTVADVYFDAFCKKAVYFYIEQQGENGKSLLLPLEEAQSISDAIVIEDEINLSYPADVDTTVLRRGFLDMPVYTQNGNNKGEVSDIQFAPSGKVMKISTEVGEFPPSAIGTIGDVIILKGAIKAKAPAKKRNVTIPRPETDYPVYILNSDAEADNSINSIDTTVQNMASEKSNVARNAVVATSETVNDKPKQIPSQSEQQKISEDKITIKAVTVNTATVADTDKTTEDGQVETTAVPPTVKQAAEKTVPVNTAPISTTPTNTAQVNTVQTNSAPTSTVLTEISVTATAKPPVALSSDTREPVLSNGAFQMILDGSAAYSYDEDMHTPTRVICDYEFLLGRTLGSDLRTYTGELIATRGSAVTDSIVEKARRAGKLVELTLNSVKVDKKN